MTTHSENANRPSAPPRHPNACAAWGCPLWGSIRLAGNPDWLCQSHALAEPADWQDRTARLNRERAELKRCHYAMHQGGEWRADFAAAIRRAEGENQ